ncbi:MAG: hypothetical protein Q4G25_15575 [Paracoccus sp. (in: a-proteobacteria)]|nr:hypothetical protein [Paracoccus sp. (in: a-proteobacteria)]
MSGQTICAECDRRMDRNVVQLWLFSFLVGAVVAWKVWGWSGGDPFLSFLAFQGGMYGIYLALAIIIHKIFD